MNAIDKPRCLANIMVVALLDSLEHIGDRLEALDGFGVIIKRSGIGSQLGVNEWACDSGIGPNVTCLGVIGIIVSEVVKVVHEILLQTRRDVFVMSILGTWDLKICESTVQIE